MLMLDIKRTAVGEKNGFYIQESKNETYFPGRRADVFVNGQLIGAFGILHPQVLGAFEISYPTSALEINIEPFL